MHSEIIKHWTLAVAASLSLSTAVIADDKFVGVWEGPYATPVYTKLVFHDDQSLTYCDVMSCRQVNCFKMNVSGSLNSEFFYEDDTGKWTFAWLNDEEIEASFTNAEGDVSTSYYEPE